MPNRKFLRPEGWLRPDAAGMGPRPKVDEHIAERYDQEGKFVGPEPESLRIPPPVGQGGKRAPGIEVQNYKHHNEREADRVNQQRAGKQQKGKQIPGDLSCGCGG